jgi:hypothetical protein
VGIHQETPLNTNLGINNERQDCKIVPRGRVLVCGANEGDAGEGIWLMNFIYVHGI